MAGPFGNFFGSRLAPPPPPLPQPKKSLGQGVGGLCCSAPDGSGGWCFDANYSASGRCGAVWGYDPAGGGAICVPDTSGDPWSVGWVHPACPSGAPPAPPPEPPPPSPAPEPPPSDEEALACQTNGTFDLYDVTGQLVAADVAEEDLPAGVEIVAVDDPRCGPAPEPGVVPPTGDVPSAIPAPGPTAKSIPTTPLPPLPGAPQAPAQGPFTSQIYPCGTKLPVSVRSLRTETLPSRPDSWQDQWTSLYR